MCTLLPYDGISFGDQPDQTAAIGRTALKLNLYKVSYVGTGNCRISKAAVGHKILCQQRWFGGLFSDTKPFHAIGPDDFVIRARCR